MGRLTTHIHGWSKSLPPAFFVFTWRDKCHMQKADTCRSLSICPQVPILFGSIIRPFLTVPLVRLQCAIVVFLDHTHLLYNILRTMAKLSEIKLSVGNLDSSLVEKSSKCVIFTVCLNDSYRCPE